MVVLLSMLSLSPLRALSDEASHRAAAQEYMAVTQSAQKMKGLLSQIKKRHLSEIEKWYIPDGQQSRMVEYVEQISALVNRELGWAGLQGEFEAAYMEVFTETELRGLSEFYRSELGQAYLSKREHLLNLGVDIAQKRVRKLMPEVEALGRALNPESSGDK